MAHAQQAAIQQAAIQHGSIPHTILLYTVSEPGEWTVEDIADDLPDFDTQAAMQAVEALVESRLLHQNSADRRLWPLRAGKDALKQAS